MIEDFIFDNLDSFNDIDTSDINLDDGLSGASSDLDDSFAPTEEIDFDLDECDDFHSFVTEPSIEEREDFSAPQHIHYREPVRTSQISFGLGCHCMVQGCGCRSFEGKFGCVCTNCHHGYDKNF